MAKKKNRVSTSGFTLIELVIYSALVTIIMGALVMTSVNVLAARARIIAMEEVSHNARIALGKITHEIRQSESIEEVGGIDGSSLKLIDPEATVVEFDLEGGALQISRGEGSTPFALTSESVIVSSLQFSDVSYDEVNPRTIRIEMIVKFANPLERPEWDFERTFYTTENVRK